VYKEEEIQQAILTVDKWNLYGVADCHHNQTFSRHSMSFHVDLVEWTV